MTSEESTRDTLAIEHSSNELPQKHPFNTRLKWTGVACVVIVVCTLAMKFYQPQQPSPAIDATPSKPTPAPVMPLESSTNEMPNATLEPTQPVDKELSQASDTSIVSLEPMAEIPAENKDLPAATLPDEPPQESPAPVMMDETVPPALPTEVVSQPSHEMEMLLANKDVRIKELECLLKLESADVSMIKIGLQECYAVLMHAGISQSDMYTLNQAAQNDHLVSAVMLRDEFQTNIPKALHAEQENFIKEASWYANLKQSMQSMFVIRKKGWQEGSSTEAFIGRAEVFLNQNNIKQALSEIQTLPENSQKAFAVWSMKAQAFNTLESIKQQLKRRVTIDTSTNEAHHGN